MFQVEVILSYFFFFKFILLLRKSNTFNTLEKGASISEFFQMHLFFYRYNLPILIIVVNNNGIYTGLDADTWKEMSNFGDLATW